MSEGEVAKKSLKIPFKLWGPAVLAVLLVAVGAGGASYVVRQKPEVLGLSKGVAQVQAETDALVTEIGKLIALPSDEKPTVASITDIDKLKDQAFFKNAKNGDKVLIYTNAKKAILYRPEEKRIIDVGAVNINQAAAPVKVTLYNGTEKVGLTTDTETLLKAKVTNVEVVAKKNAVKRDYAKSLVVDLTGTREADAKALATVLGAEVGQLPDGEEKPADADFVVIVGQDQVK